LEAPEGAVHRPEAASLLRVDEALSCSGQSFGISVNAEHEPLGPKGIEEGLRMPATAEGRVYISTGRVGDEPGLYVV
jgi:hypothetical protein